MTPGLRIGKYEVGVRLGKGSFGVVHLARDVELGREVAIKFLRPEFGAREQIVQRFLQEARAAAKIGHPGIVTVFECGVVSGTGRHDGTAYIVMERLAGQSLGDRVEAKHAWTYQTIVAIGRQLALALKAAHDSGIIHRDLKPDNVFLVPDAAVVGGERAKILDFGIAKLDDPGPGGMHTHSKMILGTPRYMSPEQARSSTNIDARSDIYALGCMFYELITGRAPFEGDTGDIMFHHQATEVPPITTLVDNAPAKLDALLRQMLEKKPDKRPPNMQAIDTALAAIDDADAVKPAVRHRARFVSSPVTTDVAEPPRPKRISAAGELSTKPVAAEPPARDSGQRVKVDLDAVPSPSEEHTAPSQKLAMLMARTSEPTFKAVRHDRPVFEESELTDRDLRPAANSTLRTQRTNTNAVWFAAAGGVLLLLALVMVVRCGGSKHVASPEPPADAALREPDANEERTALEKECQGLLAKRAWDKLDHCGRELAKMAPDTSKQLVALAFAEARALSELREIRKLAVGDLAEATIHSRAIPPTSVYRDETDTELARVRKDYVEQQVAALAGYAGAHDCEAHGYVLTSIENAHGKPLREELERSAQPCVPGDQPSDPAPERPSRRKPRGEPLTIREDPPPSSKVDCAETSTLLALERKGDELAGDGAYAAALTAYELAFRCRPVVAQKAYLAACKSRNFAKARLYYRMVGRDSLAQICLKEGFDPRP